MGRIVENHPNAADRGDARRGRSVDGVQIWKEDLGVNTKHREH